MSFQVISVAADSIVGDEQLGSKRKFWFSREENKWLFKEGREGTGEDWAEKIAAEVAKLIDVDAAEVELAECAGRHGSASKSFVGPGENLIHGNEILAGMIVGYDKQKRLHQSDHTFANIAAAVQKLIPTLEQGRQVLRRLASYLVLDALICNTDRHHENWGLLFRFERAEGSVHFRVAPTFDHASSLGRELLDERRAAILQQGLLEMYMRKGHGGVFLRPSDRRGANPLHLVEYAFRQYPEYFQSVLERVAGASDDALQGIMDAIPDGRMSQMAKDFAGNLMCSSRRVLVGLVQ